MSTEKGHPKGLYLLFVTEMWERFSYYGMRALFSLFLLKALLFDKDATSTIYGSYTGLVYLTPLIGGYVADRYWGNRRSIIFGGLVMALGQFCMFFSALNYTDHSLATALMFVGLGLLIFGNGFFKPNISTMVGDLYEPQDKRKDSAFTIFYMGINVGAFMAPLVCGAFGDTGNAADFKWGFLMAGIGMLIGVAVFYTLKNKYLVTPEGKQIGLKPAKIDPINSLDKEHRPKSRGIVQMMLWALLEIVLFLLINRVFNIDIVGSIIYSLSIVVPSFIITDNTLTKDEKSRIFVIYLIAFFVIFFWAAYEQAGVSLTFFAEEQTNRNFLGFTIPASYFQSCNPIIIVLFAPLLSLLWSKLGKHNMEPASPTKQALGLFLLSLGYLFISYGVQGIAPGQRVNMMWLIGLYFIHTMGELCLSPIGLSLVNKLSPARFSSLLMAVWFMSNAASDKFAGALSSFYPEVDPKTGVTIAKSFLGFSIENLHDFFMIFVVMSGISAIILFALSKKLQKMMRGVE
jgi:proton-dependent oligopeptide transporter, POT family